MKNLDYYIENNNKKKGKTCILFTKNNEKDIDGIFSNINQKDFDEILVSDEYSTDNTALKLRKYTDKIFFSNQNFLDRQKELLNNTRYKYLFIIEADHRFEKRFFTKMYNEFINSNTYVLDSLLRINKPKNYFEDGMSLLYEYLKKPGNNFYFSVPCITYSEFVIDMMNSVEINFNSSIDTEFTEHLKKKKIKMKTSKLIAYQKEDLNYKILKEKFSWYGTGDYYFYKNNHNKWTIARKIKSLSHVFIRYFFVLPFFSIFNLRFKLIPFFILCGILRYSAFFKLCFKK